MTHLLPKFDSRTQQRGMTLIEILVAIVVLSIGLLGLAGLQLKGLQVNQGSIYRWQAAILAEDIADRMRADQTSALNGCYVVTGGAPAACATGGTLAAINDWLQRIKTLPNGTATIAAGATANQVTISVSWLDTRAGAAVNQTTTQDSFVLNTEF